MIFLSSRPVPASERISRDWGFSHITSSPGYPQSDGQAEKIVQRVKEILLKCEEAGLDPCLGLLNYRITTLEEIG